MPDRPFFGLERLVSKLSVPLGGMLFDVIAYTAFAAVISPCLLLLHSLPLLATFLWIIHIYAQYSVRSEYLHIARELVVLAVWNVQQYPFRFDATSIPTQVIFCYLIIQHSGKQSTRNQRALIERVLTSMLDSPPV